jgi:hypothetical protein
LFIPSVDPLAPDPRPMEKRYGIAFPAAARQPGSLIGHEGEPPGGLGADRLDEARKRRSAPRRLAVTARTPEEIARPGPVRRIACRGGARPLSSVSFASPPKPHGTGPAT